MILLNSN